MFRVYSSRVCLLGLGGDKGSEKNMKNAKVLWIYYAVERVGHLSDLQKVTQGPG